MSGLRATGCQYPYPPPLRADPRRGRARLTHEWYETTTCLSQAAFSAELYDGWYRVLRSKRGQGVTGGQEGGSGSVARRNWGWLRLRISETVNSRADHLERADQLNTITVSLMLLKSTISPFVYPGEWE